jgi:putative hemolysin
MESFVLGSLAILFFILLSAFFAAAEASLLGVSRVYLRTLLKQKLPGAENLAKLKSDQRRMLITVLICNNIANVAASVLAADIALIQFGDAGLGVATAVMSFLLLTFADMIPKSLATTTHGPKFALLIAQPMLALEWLLTPLITFFEVLIRLIPGTYSYTARGIPITEEYIHAALEVGVEDRAISGEEKKMLTAVLNFSDLRAKDVMVPKSRVVCLNESDKVSTLASRLSRTPHPRFPVLNKDSEVTGMAELSHIMRAHMSSASVIKLSSKPYFASKELAALSLLRQMQHEDKRMAIILDEFGNFEGIVTIEDLFEEFVGQIGPQEQLQHISSKIIVASGDTRLADIENALGIDIGDDSDSLSLFLHKRLQRIPREGDIALLRNCKIQVSEMRKNSVVRAIIHRL